MANENGPCCSGSSKPDPRNDCSEDGLVPLRIGSCLASIQNPSGNTYWGSGISQSCPAWLVGVTLAHIGISG